MRRPLAPAALAALAAAVSCGGTAPEHTPPAPTCALAGATTASRTGPAQLLPGTSRAQLRNVQVQASACADVVVFSFWQGSPGYAVGYGTGSADLAVSFTPASAAEAYTGPAVVTPAAPSQVREVTDLGVPDPAVAWLVRLDARRPFTVTRTDEALLVRIRAGSPRATRCTVGGATVRYRSGWFAELTPPWACRMFAAQPFVVRPQTDSTTWDVGVDPSAMSYAEALHQWTGTATARVLSTRVRTVSGHAATAVETEATGTGMLPAGWRTYAYVVDRGAAGTLTVSATAGVPGPGYNARKAAADELVAALTP